MTEAEARDEVCRIGRSLFERGYVHATAGNISIRLDDDAGGGYLRFVHLSVNPGESGKTVEPWFQRRRSLHLEFVHRHHVGDLQ